MSAIDLVQLENISDVIDPHPSHRAPKAVTENGIPFIGIGDIDDLGNIDVGKARSVSADIYDEHKERYSLSDDLLVLGRVASIGKVVQLPKPKEPFVISPTLAVIKPTDINISYLKYALQSPAFYEQMMQVSTGSTRKSVGMKVLRKLLVPVFESPEQKRIVAILDEAFAGIDIAIANTEKNLANARELFESYLNSVFTKRGQGWEDIKLDDACVVERGSSPRPIKAFLTDDEDGVNWVKIGDTKGITKYIYKTKQKITQEGALRSRRVDPGDFILTNSMSFGRPYIMATTGYIHDGWFVLRLKEHINTDYFYHLLSSRLVQEQFGVLAAGAVVKNISSDLVKQAVLPIPPMEQQVEIVKIVELLSEQVQELESIYDRKLAALAELKQSLLQKAFSGELTVEGDKLMDEAVA